MKGPIRHKYHQGNRVRKWTDTLPQTRDLRLAQNDTVHDFITPKSEKVKFTINKLKNTSHISFPNSVVVQLPQYIHKGGRVCQF